MLQSNNRDSIYAAPLAEVTAFTFDKTVVDVFPDMIARSVPGYTFTLPLIGLFAARYAQPHSRCYDLGCSLGAVTLAMRRHIQQPGCRIVAVDNSPAMIDRCREILAGEENDMPVELIQADMCEWPIETASVVVLNYTLQFIPPAARDALIGKIFDGLLPGGVLILSEKVLIADPAQNERFIEIHHDFKRAHGYSDLEISQKRSALENVLIPETVEQHQQRLQMAGFTTGEVWFQAFNFVSLLAIKDEYPHEADPPPFGKG